MCKTADPQALRWARCSQSVNLTLQTLQADAEGFCSSMACHVQK